MLKPTEIETSTPSPYADANKIAVAILAAPIFSTRTGERRLDAPPTVALVSSATETIERLTPDQARTLAAALTTHAGYLDRVLAAAAREDRTTEEGDAELRAERARLVGKRVRLVDGTPVKGNDRIVHVARTAWIGGCVAYMDGEGKFHVVDETVVGADVLVAIDEDGEVDFAADLEPVPTLAAERARLVGHRVRYNVKAGAIIAGQRPWNRAKSLRVVDVVEYGEDGVPHAVYNVGSYGPAHILDVDDSENP